MRQDRLFVWKSHWNRLGGLQVGWCGASGNHQIMVKGVSHIKGDSDVVATCICMQVGGRAKQRNKMVSAWAEFPLQLSL